MGPPGAMGRLQSIGRLAKFHRPGAWWRLAGACRRWAPASSVPKGPAAFESYGWGCLRARMEAVGVCYAGHHTLEASEV